VRRLSSLCLKIRPAQARFSFGRFLSVVCRPPAKHVKSIPKKVHKGYKSRSEQRHDSVKGAKAQARCSFFGLARSATHPSTLLFRDHLPPAQDSEIRELLASRFGPAVAQQWVTRASESAKPRTSGAGSSSSSSGVSPTAPAPRVVKAPEQPVSQQLTSLPNPYLSSLATGLRFATRA
jgi:hypothetical protein